VMQQWPGIEQAILARTAKEGFPCQGFWRLPEFQGINRSFRT